jgi:hypothetical protein
VQAYKKCNCKKKKVVIGRGKKEVVLAHVLKAYGGMAVSFISSGGLSIRVLQFFQKLWLKLNL